MRSVREESDERQANTQDAKSVDDLRSRDLRPQDMPWQKLRFPGCEMKTLLFDPKNGLATMLMKMEPGAVLPDIAASSRHESKIVDLRARTRCIFRSRGLA